jgi:hypothetical protein
MSESRNCEAGWHDRCHGSAQEQRGMGQRWASVRRRSECGCPMAYRNRVVRPRSWRRRSPTMWTDRSASRPVGR